MSYQPPYTITANHKQLVANIEQLLSTAFGQDAVNLSPQLRRKNRIRTIQASLAIENNTLTVEQVTAVLEGKQVLGLPQEIQEVRNAFTAYEKMPGWRFTALNDLLEAHQCLMQGLADDAGQLRSKGVGIYQGNQLVHMAPPAQRIPALMNDLLHWLAHTKENPLISSCVFHYEFEFIHPFSDGNGRMGRLWQTLILSQWRSQFAYLPVETLIKARQAEYYRVLGEADQQAEATPFISFMLSVIHQALSEAINLSLEKTESDQVSDQVKRLLTLLSGQSPLTAKEIMQSLGLKHKPTFRKNYITPALQQNWIAMTQPDSPQSPTQKYRLTEQGILVVKQK